jgi:hypothetical protein
VPHLHRDWARPCHICTGTGLAPATSAPGLGSPLPHLHRDWAGKPHASALASYPAELRDLVLAAPTDAFDNNAITLDKARPRAARARAPRAAPCVRRGLCRDTALGLHLFVGPAFLLLSPLSARPPARPSARPPALRGLSLERTAQRSTAQPDTIGIGFGIGLVPAGAAAARSCARARGCDGRCTYVWERLRLVRQVVRESQQPQMTNMLEKQARLRIPFRPPLRPPGGPSPL